RRRGERTTCDTATCSPGAAGRRSSGRRASGGDGRRGPRGDHERGPGEAGAGARPESRELRGLLGGEHDALPAIVSINAGAGGTDACDWAEMLLRMYLRWAERRGYSCEVVDRQEGDEAGIASGTL